MDLPADLNSISTLEYLGITTAVATDVHSRWLNIRSDPFFHDIELYQVTIDHIRLRGEYTDHYFGQNADWTIDLRSMGATEELIQGIMAEGHDAVRNSKTAREWFLDSIELRYQYLEDLQDDPEPKENPHIIGLDDTSHLSHVPGHTALYMGLSRTAAELLWKSNIEHEKGQLVLQRLGTKPASDFSGLSACYHFTPDWQVAYKHARFIERRIKHGGVCVIRIDVPDTILDDVTYRAYHARSDSDTWRRAIFWSRRGKDLTGKFDDPAGSNLVITDYSSINSWTVKKMGSWNEIGREHVFWLDEAKTKAGTQYIFWEEIEKRIEAECQDKAKVYLI